MSTVSRRAFVKVGAAAGGGLLLSFTLPAPLRRAMAARTPPPASFAPNAFIRIDRDGRVTLIMHKVEMGQGTYTSMPIDRKSTRLNSSHLVISYAVFCLKKKKKKNRYYDKSECT